MSLTLNKLQALASSAASTRNYTSNDVRNIRTPDDLGISFSISGSDYAAYISNSPTGRSGFLLSVDPLSQDTTSYINFGETISYPFEASAEFAISNRAVGDYFNLELVNANNDIAPDSNSNSISSIQQTATTLTISSLTPFSVNVDDWIDITGVTDNRLNYCNASVASISTDKLTITVTTANDATIPSLTVGAYTNQGTVIPINHFNSKRDGLGFRFSSATATNASLLSRYNGSSTHSFGVVGGAANTAIGTTAIIYPVATTGQSTIKPTNKYFIKADSDNVTYIDRVTDASTVGVIRALSTGVKSSYGMPYQFRLRSKSPKSNPRPIAKIVSAVKTGTTTATITTDAPHGLITGNYVTLVGIRDTTNFPNLTTAAMVTVVDTVTFTVIIGGVATATSYGGAVIIAHGGYTQPALIPQVVQSAAVDASNNVTLIGSASWSTGVGVMNVGDLVNLYGVRDNTTGADLGLDGIYWVNTISTTTLILSPISALSYVTLGGNGTSPVHAVLTTTNCGGCVILRDTAYISDISLISKSISSVTIEGQGTADLTKALPVYIGNSPTVVQGAKGTVGAGWYIEPDNLLVADIASAAITTTTTTAAITPVPSAGAAEFNIIVTAVTGTNPTMDLVIQESDDSGTNWYDIYHFPRITATGAYRTPVLPLTGNRLRYVQTIGGTTPSFTRALNRITHLMVSPPVYRQIIDRVIAVNTLNSTTAALKTNGSNSVQVVINMGAITTTAPQIQIEGSDDVGATWYAIGSPLTSVASSTVQLTVPSINADFVRARISTAGSGATLGYLLLKSMEM